jgi:hypothetical protein
MYTLDSQTNRENREVERYAVSANALIDAKRKRGTNQECASFIRKRVNFLSDHETIYGYWEPDAHDLMRFSVYSYGGHFPLGVWDDAGQRWWVHGEKYSRTTSQHMNIFRRAIAGQPQVDTDFHTLLRIASDGVAGHITRRLIAA